MIRIHKIIYDNLLNEDKGTNTRDKTRPCTRAANIVKENFFKCLPIVGAIPGVEIGDKFNNRTELSLIGLHLPKQPGIASNSTTNNKCEFRICVSIVASENDYENDMKDPNYLVYSGHGGLIKKNKGEGKDQKLKGGNLTLANSKIQKNEVRVIRGRMENGKNVYIYYGLYVVEDWYKTRGKSGNLIYKFCLKRIPGQPPIQNA
ncbi:YDG domain-containing protein At5g47150-like [Impatiens glandulifera]|uniref:YDG domain-containing protein At5g47150-like n=1 Tax=Impatiens glandulifera TaxID=253017 RepID=UPI001FB14F75|nr:YDG domain-containing protein At5g47150-like [Impatiens glandulifera]